MKLRRAAIVLGISACLLGTQVQSTFGLTTEQKALLTEEEIQLIEAGVLVYEDVIASRTAAVSTPEETVVEEAVPEETVEETPEAITEEVPEVTEEIALDTTGDVDIDAQNDDASDDENSDGTPEDGQGEDGEDTDGEGGTGDTPGETPAEEPAQGSVVTPAIDGYDAVELKDETNVETSDEYYTRNTVTPSGAFLNLKDKVKYNSTVPIEGIPSFITQEMVIAALKCQDETGFPASVTIAQIIQESGFGVYGAGGDSGQGLSYLAYQYNNLFGIKGVGTAGTVEMTTGEEDEAGNAYTTVAGFRVYNTYTECVEDRTEILKEVYSDLLVGVTDANTFAYRIGARWATSLDYAESLVYQMETYNLYRLDDMTLKDFSEMIGTFADPCPGTTLSSAFGSRVAPLPGATTFHLGLDMATGGVNLPVYAAAEGVVTFAGEAGACGNMVVIDHQNGLVTKYEHLEAIYVKEGDSVNKAEQIGLAGTTGNSTGIHLHFQVEENGAAVDPTPYLESVDN